LLPLVGAVFLGCDRNILDGVLTKEGRNQKDRLGNLLYFRGYHGLSQPYKKSNVNKDVNNGATMEETDYEYIKVVFLAI
jgi:hypothetical protein